MKIATAAYPLDWLDSWNQYEDKIASWVGKAAGDGADVLVFPEYGAMELATLDGPEIAGGLESILHSVAEKMEDAAKLHQKLATEFGVYILGGSGPAHDPAFDRPVNRAEFYAPGGARDHQDKQIMTPYERTPWDVASGGPLKLFDTAFGKIGVLICYDSEYPLFGKALTEADILLVPSNTESLAGYWRVRVGCMARALEQQCVTVMSSVVGPAAWNEAVENNTGMGGIFCPPDNGFPSTGVIAEGTMNTPGWTIGEVDLATIAAVRKEGHVRNRSHWEEQLPRAGAVINRALR